MSADQEAFRKCKVKLKHLLKKERFKDADEFYQRIVSNSTISEEDIEQLEQLYAENT